VLLLILSILTLNILSRLSSKRKALNRHKPIVKNGNLITFDLENYTFADFGAHIALRMSSIKKGAEVFSKTYYASGKAQGGKMLWGGAFAMKNAIQQSTRLALD